ncbi:hypothetical protein [Actinocorallia longicatena]|uniref:Uncharacterized protein n=1 Tax=Actinocorallia longicatena TaxID=111803 RepID=A0ABP6QCK4_9ACTN
MRKIGTAATSLALAAGSLTFASPALAAPATSVITIESINHAPNYIGDSVTIVGSLSKANGDGITGRPVLLDAAGNDKIVTTTDDGLFVAKLKFPKSGVLSARFLGDGSYKKSSATTQNYAIQYRTAIYNFKARPNPVEKNQAFSITGTTYRIGLDSDLHDQSQRTSAGLDLLTSTDGGKVWNWVASANSNGDGGFRFTQTAGGDARWRVVLKPNPVADGLLGTQREVWVDARYRTSLSAKVGPRNIRKGKKITVSGKLVHKVDGHWSALGKVRVAVLFRAKGSKTWKFKGWAWVGANGKYSKKIKDTRDGYWRVKYHGSGSNFVAYSGTTYVNVR